MDIVSLNAVYRSGTGKTPSRRLRADGKIPAICYGKKEEPILLSIDPKGLAKALDPVRKTNTVLELQIAGEGYAGPAKVMVMLRDWQRNPLRGDVTHADFVRVKLDEEVHATVAVVLFGKCLGVTKGGTLHTVYRTLEISCTPDKIPAKLDISIEHLDLGDALHVRDVKFPEGVRPLLDGGQTVCTITIPRAEKGAEAKAEVVEAAPAAAAKGGTAAKGAEGAAAKGAKGAEGAAAKGGKK